MPDVEVSVGFGWKSGLHTAIIFPVGNIVGNDLPDKIKWLIFSVHSIRFLQEFQRRVGIFHSLVGFKLGIDNWRRLDELLSERLIEQAKSSLRMLINCRNIGEGNTFCWILRSWVAPRS